MKRLTDNEVDFNLTTLKGWCLDEHESRIIKSFSFKNFKEAFAAMTKIAALAEAMDHHPDWYNAYNKLNIKLSTHSAGGLTLKDFELAQGIEKIVNVSKPKRPRL